MKNPSRPGTRHLHRRRALRALLVTCLAALVVLVPVSAASAHATLLSSDPPDGSVLQVSPDVITFTFDETVTLVANSVQVFDAKGNVVPAEVKGRDAVVSAAVPAHLPRGSYVVAWRVISADSHPVAGSITFSVGAPSLTVTPPKIATGTDHRVQVPIAVLATLTYVGLFLAGGLLLFQLWTTRGIRLRPETGRRLDRVRWVASVVVVIAAALSVPLNGANDQALGLGGILQADAFDLSLVGDDVIVAGAQILGLALALVFVRRLPWLAATGAVLAVLSPAFVGHSRATYPVSLVMASDVLHLLAAATWLGGLVGLALILGSLSGRENDAATVIARFSVTGAWVLGALTLTGTIAAWRIIDSWSGLVETGYGRVLLVKIAVVAVTAAVAGYNRYRLVPRVRAAVGHAARRTAAGRVRNSVRAEAALIVGVLGLTGFLVDLSPNQTVASRAPVASRVSAALAGRTKVLATLSPGHIGPNTLTVQIQDESGEPLEGYAAPTISVSSPTVDLGQVTINPIASGTYAAKVVLPQAGTWTVEVSLRATEFDNPVTDVDVRVR